MTGIAEKMKLGGYATHFAGKWDAGMATQQHTPQGRGYDSSLNYFQHANDYWCVVTPSCCKVRSDPTSGPLCCRTSIGASCTNKTTKETVQIVDLWDTDQAGSKYNNSWACSQANQAPGCVYEDEVRRMWGRGTAQRAGGH